MGRVFGALVVALAVMVGTFAPSARAAGAQTADREDTEAQFVERINDLRAAKGLRRLEVDNRLRSVARDWAATMAGAGRISHRPDLAAVAPDPLWVKIGENVGVGGTVDSLHDAFVKSHDHYVNLVDPAWHYIAIGVVFSGDTIYVTENFMQVDESAARPAAAPEASRQKPPVAAPAAPPATERHARTAPVEHMCGPIPCRPAGRLVTRT